MENDSRPAEEVQAKIKALAEEYETLTGDKLLVRRIKSHRPQEIWAWMNSLAHEYSVITGKKIRFEEGSTVSNSPARDPSRETKDECPSNQQQEGPTLHCSFCGKSQHEVSKLIAGPTVFICDECVTLCMSIVEDSPDVQLR